ncbi:MAG TPA: efflux RND transporter periplasmic adaptor subunit [Sedimentisphaerales bacterium]|nr:efflux RND transporter periplasmic adaptor subunit [Sedimentisphaerales bacterium]
MKKFFSVLLVLLIVALIGWQAYTRITASAAKTSPGRLAVAVAIETKPIRKDVIRDIGIFTGSLLPKSQFIIAPKVAGWLKKLLVNIGDTVQQNKVIAILDDEECTQQVQQARAELQVAKANAENCTSDLDIAKREYERAKALREKQIASASELDESEAAFNACQTRLKVSLAQVAQMESALKTADVRLSYTKVQAFWEDGDEPRVIGEKFVDEGALLQVNEPIVSILENNPLTAVVYVIERDYQKVKVGQQSVVTTDAYPDKTFTGSVVRIAPLLKESSRQARVEIEVPNPDQLLKPGMFVRAKIEFARHDNATLVPFAALVRREGKEGIFIADTSALKARFVPVTTGIINGELAEVTEPEISGLVVTMGNHLLEDGSDIMLPEKKLSEEIPQNRGTKSNKASVNTGSGDSR